MHTPASQLYHGIRYTKVFNLEALIPCNILALKSQKHEITLSDYWLSKVCNLSDRLNADLEWPGTYWMSSTPVGRAKHLLFLNQCVVKLLLTST